MKPRDGNMQRRDWLQLINWLSEWRISYGLEASSSQDPHYMARYDWRQFLRDAMSRWKMQKGRYWTATNTEHWPVYIGRLYAFRPLWSTNWGGPQCYQIRTWNKQVSRYVNVKPTIYLGWDFCIISPPLSYLYQILECSHATAPSWVVLFDG